MANWESFTVRNIVDRINNGDIVLPNIQRSFVWKADKMEELFDSLFGQNSFGAIICTEEKMGLTPLYPYRPFSIDGELTQSSDVQTAPKNLLFVIDGQQRLQTFYIGLCGKLCGKPEDKEDKTLYYDLFSDYSLLEHNFKFAARTLPKFNNERSERIENNRGGGGLNFFEKLSGFQLLGCSHN